LQGYVAKKLLQDNHFLLYFLFYRGWFIMADTNRGMSFKRGRMKNEVMKMVKKILILFSVLLCMLIFTPGVLAATTGTAAVSGNPESTISLDVAGSQSFGAMTLGDNLNSSANTVSTTVYSNVPWTLTVRDALSDAKTAGSAGKMAEWDGVSAYPADGKVLVTPLKMGLTSDTDVILSGASQTLTNGATAGTFVNYPYFKQTIVIADPRLETAGHVYRMVVTFDVGAT
jgi:hypothetical protein